MMPEEKLRKADIVTSICLIFLGLAVLYGASQMPMKGTYGGVTNVWYVSPAVLPILIGVLVIVFSAGILIRAIKFGGHKNIIPYFSKKLEQLPRNIEALRITIIWILSSIYIFGLLGRTNFYLAGFLYLCPFMLLFYRPRGNSLKMKHASLISLICILLPIVIGYLFNKYLYVPLP
ncbi:MAG: tripartite tricarboxylate transporter TctB family protein [Deltaproteobacteria bacterium]|nr:tripartite tricarboxylate transporter TctB family protein [Deltaproteobacteria bacterium]